MISIFIESFRHDVGVEPLDASVVEGQHVVLDGLDQPETLPLFELVGVLGGGRFWSKPTATQSVASTQLTSLKRPVAVE